MKRPGDKPEPIKLFKEPRSAMSIDEPNLLTATPLVFGSVAQSVEQWPLSHWFRVRVPAGLPSGYREDLGEIAVFVLNYSGFRSDYIGVPLSTNLFARADPLIRAGIPPMPRFAQQFMIFHPTRKVLADS